MPDMPEKGNLSMSTNTPSIIGQISDDLNKALQDNINAIPEEVFVHHFLPMFCGEIPPNSDLPAMWAAVAGNPFMPVNVIDKDHKVIYQVPALYDREAVYLGERDPRANSMMHVVITMQQMANISPAQANNYLAYQLQLRNMLRASPELEKRIQQLNEIFKRYGKPEISLNSDKTQGVEPQSSGSTRKPDEAPELIFD